MDSKEYRRHTGGAGKRLWRTLVEWGLRVAYEHHRTAVIITVKTIKSYCQQCGLDVEIGNISGEGNQLEGKLTSKILFRLPSRSIKVLNVKEVLASAGFCV